MAVRPAVSRTSFTRRRIAVAGLAFASTQSAPIGTGVVVIDTNLAYQGGQAAGTGMVLTRSGEVLTNNHVIKGATTIKIRRAGDRP
jgi:S1-C subfamily serine protease